MKQNYPTPQMIQSSSDRVAALLRKAAQPQQPTFGSQLKASLNSTAFNRGGASPVQAYDKSIESDQKKAHTDDLNQLGAESSIYDMLVKQRNAGSAEADKILDVAGKLSNNDPQQMSMLIGEAYKRYPDGNITLTDAVNLAGELGIKAKKSDEQLLKEQYLKAKIGQAQRVGTGTASPAAQNAKFKDDLKQANILRTNAEGAQEFLSKVDTLEKSLVDLGDQGMGPRVGSEFGRGVGTWSGTDSEKRRRKIDADLAALQLSVAQMKLKGQGQVTESERAIAKDTLPKLTNDLATNLAIIADLKNEAARTVKNYHSFVGQPTTTLPLSENIPEGGSIDATVGAQSPSKITSPSTGGKKTLAEQAAELPDDGLGGLKNKYGLQ